MLSSLKLSLINLRIGFVEAKGYSVLQLDIDDNYLTSNE
jgi:hypothetical protein